MPPQTPHARANRLANETSPYLLQHAHNPVDWFPWGDEAFELARQRDVPVFLSIGYSTCYWCHVMERESFENQAIAQVMNERFVCIKVDREERPDLDELYMAATTTFTGSGGWPMSVFLEPKARKPFYAGTYFPPTPMHNRPAFPELLTGLSDAWTQRKGEVLEQAQRLADAVAEQVAIDAKPVAVGEAQLTGALSALLQRLDQTHGGFSHAPKFPQPVFLEFLLDMRPVADASTRSAIDLALKKTLDAMALGGINDQVGGGFHRYSVDERWTVPHFEKMLYDNAQLARVYTRASVALQDPWYAAVCARTLDWCLREMTDSAAPGAAGFFSAQDAEVDGREGLNYLWTPEEVQSALSQRPELIPLATEAYALDASPNFRDPHHPDEPPRHVLRLEARPSELAQKHELEQETFDARMQAINTALLAHRNDRPQPALDDKVLVSWNAMLIAALVEAGQVLARRDYIDAGASAARFITSELADDRGGLLRAHRAGRSAIPALLEDYAHLLDALLALNACEQTQEAFPIAMICNLADAAHELFADSAGAYCDTRDGAADLFVRARTLHDGATPGASGVMLHALIELARRADEPLFAQRAADLMRASSAAIASSPMGAINTTRALLAMLAQRQRYAPLIDFAAAGAQGDQEGAPQGPSPVSVLVSTDAITVSDDSPASFKVALEIQDGHHVAAADPGQGEAAGSLYPLRAGLITGQGVAVYADYPKGQPKGVESVGTFNAYTGRIEFDVAIEKADGIGASPGAPVLGLSFQACSDTQCLRPQTVRLAIAITIE